MFAATLPDPRIGALLSATENAGEWDHLVRLPYWPYWGPMLTVLNAHRDEVARLVPHAAAKLCALWLKSVPVELGEGQPMPWRKEAAELALAIGREVQALNAEGNYYSDGHDKAVYEAVLSAAPELPDEVAQLCLELAQRRDLDPAIVARVEQAHERQREQRRQFLEANPERRERSSFPRLGRRASCVILGRTARAIACRMHFRRHVSTPGPFRRSCARDRTPRLRSCWRSASSRRNMRILVAARCPRPASIIGMAAILPCIVAVLSFSFSRMPRIRDCPLRYGSSISQPGDFVKATGSRFALE